MNDEHSGHPEIPVTAESLDSATISAIEALHAAVLKAEAEQRFGLLRGRRTKQMTEAVYPDGAASEFAAVRTGGFLGGAVNGYNDRCGFFGAHARVPGVEAL